MTAKEEFLDTILKYSPGNGFHVVNTRLGNHKYQIIVTELPNGPKVNIYETDRKHSVLRVLNDTPDLNQTAFSIHYTGRAFPLTPPNLASRIHTAFEDLEKEKKAPSRIDIESLYKRTTEALYSHFLNGVVQTTLNDFFANK